MTDTTASVLTGGQGGADTTASTTTATTTQATTTTATTTQQTGAAPVTWLGQADELTTGYVQNKGWQSAADAVKSYQNLEKLLGADKAGNAVVIPKADAAPEEMSAFFNRLGRPVDAAGYKIDVPEGGSKDFATAAAGKFHELGLSQKQGEALAAWWNQTAGEQTTAATAARASQFQADDAALKTAWGQAFQQNLVHAQQAVRGLGLDGAMIDKLSDSIGHKATMELFQKIGSRMGEDSFVAGDGKEPFGNALTPGQAKARIAELMKDKTFTARYLNKDADAKAEMERLHKFAYPEE
ncbi:hypothetical protein BLA39750_02222 [Burkholderia lata]|uniref:Capsid assembly protein n=1 Tax=Burkholderia lata (strain ATCC 17760 / DSM 23089 / LMG 22485 / NCIMB 9086 / R18194 / 383) TaxID=482957 RepID=A0A6P2W8D2_BURL3|nr:hypothetical protein [Burkholderia lata]VWC95938.1 hypothetical protein BLA39750_02222 [Burkholderia lata]